ncbi:unnamed protein product [Calypogeia fissa]
MVKSSGMYIIMFRICRQPSYWFAILLITILGMGPILALKYFWFFYQPNAINVLQQLEHSQSSSRGFSTVQLPATFINTLFSQFRSRHRAHSCDIQVRKLSSHGICKAKHPHNPEVIFQ